MRAGVVIDAVRPLVDGGDLPGAVAGVLSDGELSVDAVGSWTPTGGPALRPGTVMRVSSNTKPMVAALTLILADDGVLALDDPVDRFVPELADRRVLRHPGAPADHTVPAERPVTVEDLLTMRLGFGFVFEADCPTVEAATAAGLGIGPPDPALPFTPDSWIARFAGYPLVEQPGTVWRYDLAYAVLGVVLARAAGRDLDHLLRHHLLDPLGMADTRFVAAPGTLPPAYLAGGSGLAVFDPADDSRWTRPPSFPDARCGLVSTATDLLRFAGALLDGGRGVLTPQAVDAMTTDRLTPAQRRAPSATAFLDGHGWGYGVQVVSPGRDRSVALPRYGWGGGLGTLWYSWPEQRTAAVVLTQVLPPSPELVAAFLGTVESALLRR